MLGRLARTKALQPAFLPPVRAYSAASSRRRRTSDIDFGGWYDTRCRSTTILSVRKDDKVVRSPGRRPAAERRGRFALSRSAGARANGGGACVCAVLDR